MPTTLPTPPVANPWKIATEAGERAALAAFHLKEILVPVDFSGCSQKALQYALPLARLNRGYLTLLYVVPSPTYAVSEYGGIDYAPMEEELRADAKRKLNALAEEVLPAGQAGRVVVRTGAPAVEILETARALGTDLIVISTHGRTGFKHALMGSVAERVVQQAPCPVLVVREHEHEFVVE